MNILRNIKRGPIHANICLVMSTAIQDVRIERLNGYFTHWKTVNSLSEVPVLKLRIEKFSILYVSFLHSTDDRRVLASFGTRPLVGVVDNPVVGRWETGNRWPVWPILAMKLHQLRLHCRRGTEVWCIQHKRHRMGKTLNGYWTPDGWKEKCSLHCGFTTRGHNRRSSRAFEDTCKWRTLVRTDNDFWQLSKEKAKRKMKENAQKLHAFHPTSGSVHFRCKPNFVQHRFRRRAHKGTIRRRGIPHTSDAKLQPTQLVGTKNHCPPNHSEVMDKVKGAGHSQRIRGYTFTESYFQSFKARTVVECWLFQILQTSWKANTTWSSAWSRKQTRLEVNTQKQRGRGEFFLPAVTVVRPGLWAESGHQHSMINKKNWRDEQSDFDWPATRIYIDYKSTSEKNGLPKHSKVTILSRGKLTGLNPDHGSCKTMKHGTTYDRQPRQHKIRNDACSLQSEMMKKTKFWTWKTKQSGECAFPRQIWNFEWED